MTNTNRAGVHIARQLLTTEHAVDTALAEMFRLGARMIEGRKDAHLAAAVGQDSLTELVSGMSALNAARLATIAVHGGLLEVAGDHGVGWRLDGPTESKPVPRTSPTGRLTVAA